MAPLKKLMSINTSTSSTLPTFAFIRQMAPGKKLSAAEKYLGGKGLPVFPRYQKAKPLNWKGDVRDYVHDCLGFATGAISEIWGHWKKYNDPKFASVGGCSMLISYN